MNNYSTKINKLKQLIADHDNILIGAGAGLSTAAGFEYSGARFDYYFSDFKEKFGIHDMYSGGFYQYPTPEITWAWWSRHIWLNRYAPAPKQVYSELLSLVQNKNYFVLTTNVDHQFQQANFDKKRLFYMQGDMGLFQSTLPGKNKNYDNYEQVKEMVLAQGFKIEQDGLLVIPENAKIKIEIPSNLVPEIANRPVKMNLRIDSEFLEDDGWKKAAQIYQDFLQKNADKKLLLLELGVGLNTPGIIKYPFWQITNQNENAYYISISKDDAFIPDEIKDKSLVFNADINQVLTDLKSISS